MKKFSPILIFLLLLSLCTGCGKNGGEEVMVESVADICGMGSVGFVDRFAGVVSPQGETKIKKSDENPVSEILVSVGDTVEAGQVLFTYDTEQISLEIQSAQLELQRYNNEVKANNEEKAQLVAEKKNAPADQQLEYTNEIQIRDANIREANNSIDSVNSRIRDLEKKINDASVKATAAGRIQSINESGGYDDMGNELPFITIVQTDSYRVKGYVNETNVSALSEGMPVILRSRVSDETWSGTISMVDLDKPTQNQNYYGDDDTAMSSKYPFYVEIKDGKGLMLGQHVYIEPDFGQGSETDPNQLNLPSYYITDIDSNPYVWAQNEHGKLEKRAISLGDYNEELDTYAVTDGLSANDFIAFPDETLSEGMICVKPEEIPDEDPANEGFTDEGASPADVDMEISEAEE